MQERTFAERLRALRKKEGWSRYELAKKIGVNPDTIKLWEEEICEPRINKARMVAQTFRVSLDFLFGTEKIEK
jgi:transcriptional regulator with XRE-family HTH domain